MSLGPTIDRLSGDALVSLPQIESSNACRPIIGIWSEPRIGNTVSVIFLIH